MTKIWWSYLPLVKNYASLYFIRIWPKNAIFQQLLLQSCKVSPTGEHHQRSLPSASQIFAPSALPHQEKKTLINSFLFHLYTLCTDLIVQYLQNVVLSFEIGSNGPNQASSDSHLSIKKSFPHWGIPLPLSAIWKALSWVWANNLGLEQLWPQKFAPRCQTN